jgi:tetratricopeptide (TPR) repeat protein
MRYALSLILLFLAGVFLPARLHAQCPGGNAVYNSCIHRADSGFAAKNYKYAREQYSAASDLLPKEQYPKNKIAECNRLEAEQTEACNHLVNGADSCYQKNDWICAKTKYSEALVLKPGDEFILSRIAACDKNIAEAAAEEQYRWLIEEADNRYSEGDYAVAISRYKEALVYKPGDPHALSQIAKCEKFLKEKK